MWSLRNILGGGKRGSFGKRSVCTGHIRRRRQDTRWYCAVFQKTLHSFDARIRRCASEGVPMKAILCCDIQSSAQLQRTFPAAGCRGSEGQQFSWGEFAGSIGQEGNMGRDSAACRFLYVVATQKTMDRAPSCVSPPPPVAPHPPPMLWHPFHRHAAPTFRLRSPLVRGRTPPLG